MTFEEFVKIKDGLMAQGLTEKDVLGVILQMLTEGKITVKEMEIMAGWMGYELNEDFIAKAVEMEAARKKK